MEDSNDPNCPFCSKLAALADLPSAEVVWQFRHSVAFLGPWQYYHGYCILIARRHARELYELSGQEGREYFDEMCVLAKAIADCFAPHKLNYELLGNQVPHLHWHLFPRYRHDPNLLQPVWLDLDRAEHDDRERQRLLTGPQDGLVTADRLRRKLQSSVVRNP